MYVHMGRCMNVKEATFSCQDRGKWRLWSLPNTIGYGPKKINPLTHDKHGRKYGDNVSYENINLDYIARLVGEGYPKDIVVRALGITRNDLEMACDILHEFGSKIQNKC
ncbi:hypothetical protein RR46_13270 [Papilio xuthus]|uniref:UBA domain-containing protein n=1 Tax=Papilio xuthus TaxID=66420 RepID=A0A194PSK6_PAPXU|nr:hypothetical protein RR46_13270 [Papilio xuthus]